MLILYININIINYLIYNTHFYIYISFLIGLFSISQKINCLFKTNKKISLTFVHCMSIIQLHGII